MTTETITALMVAPNLNPIEVRLYKGRAFLRAAVSVCCDGLCPVSVLSLGHKACILYNNEFQIFTTHCNRRVAEKVIGGVFYIVGLENGKLTSLSQDDVELYKALFWEPDEFSEDEKIDAYLANCEQSVATRISGNDIYIL